MNLDEALVLVNNLDLSEAKRRFGPPYSLVHVNRFGEVEGIYRYKEHPTEEQKVAAIKQHRGCVQIPARPGLFSTTTDLRRRIERNADLFCILKDTNV